MPSRPEPDDDEQLRDDDAVAALPRTRLERWIAEDSARDDVTAATLVPPDVRGTAAMKAKEHGVLAGLRQARAVLRGVDPSLDIESLAEDGERVAPGQFVLRVRGRCRSLLAAERPALNVVQRMSGIATLTARFVDAVAGTGVRVLATRKTTPGLRALEVAAVRCGGGDVHRWSLSDRVLVKENHLYAMRLAGLATGMADLVAVLTQDGGPGVPVGVEVTSLDELRAALVPGIDVVLLDNFDPELCREAARIRNAAPPESRVLLEASGGITLETVRPYAESGIDRVSVGALTHSARALDLNMKIVGDEDWTVPGGEG